MRSKLFVPGSRPELFAKAVAGDADALSFDLEDAVAEDRKSAAREAVATFVTSEVAKRAGKVVIVRTNAPGSAYFERDVAAVVMTGVALINLPKVESAQDLRRSMSVIEHAQGANKRKGPISVLVNIETPRALANAAQIARAHPRVAGLQLGLGDLFEFNGIDRGDARNVHAAMFSVRLAAAQAGVFAMDGAFGSLEDEDGYLKEARMARQLGFIGKTCVHPRQVSLANSVFAASKMELAAARRIVEAARIAKEQSRGAFVVDGKMIDRPLLKRAQAIVAASSSPAAGLSD